VIAHINVGFAFAKVFAPKKFIPDKSEFAENPTPQPKESVSDGSEPLA
jgi:hypothetical protein